MRNAMQVETRRRGSAPDPGKDLVGKAEARGKKAESPVSRRKSWRRDRKDRMGGRERRREGERIRYREGDRQTGRDRDRGRNDG